MEKIKELIEQLNALDKRYEMGSIGKGEYRKRMRVLERELRLALEAGRKMNVKQKCECGGVTSSWEPLREKHEQTKRHQKWNLQKWK